MSRLRQILLHLLSNALKFTEKGRMTLGDKYRGDFYVTGTGYGIKETNRQIFSPFCKNK
ncbi:ATP-binding protein [Odoribacter laneus]|uniref:ATP-binding protein n=1 Tax=Odoribacter laneus TaxID=626933 RepID=UPI003F52B65D